ncbi:MAG: hypothetical protein A2Y88_02925 [Chloroflexi bacterium RBG_13_48_10]|nr:MAG: hypothetical protein A2Y88_02925 [Chloroflexi bacterium RBG_13_48_10]
MSGKHACLGSDLEKNTTIPARYGDWGWGVKKISEKGLPRHFPSIPVPLLCGGYYLKGWVMSRGVCETWQSTKKAKPGQQESL